MEIIGSVVRSIQGRDRYRVFAVIGTDGENVTLADGRLHTLASPKRKNLRHVKAIGHLTEAETERLRESFTDETVREIIMSYDKRK